MFLYFFLLESLNQIKIEIMISNQSSEIVQFYQDCLERQSKSCENVHCKNQKIHLKNEQTLLESKIKKNELGISVCAEIIEKKNKEIKELEMKLKNKMTNANSTNYDSKLTIEPDDYKEFLGRLTESQVCELRSFDYHHKRDSAFVFNLVKAVYSNDSETIKKKSVTGRSKLGLQKEPITPEKFQLIESVYQSRLKKLDPKERVERAKKLNRYVNSAIQNSSKPKKKFKTDTEKVGVIISNCANELLVFKRIDKEITVQDFKVISSKRFLQSVQF